MKAKFLKNLINFVCWVIIIVLLLSLHSSMIMTMIGDDDDDENNVAVRNDYDELYKHYIHKHLL